MEYIQLGLAILIAVFIYKAIIGIWMKIANFIGEKLRIGKFFYKLIAKETRYK